MVSPGPLCLFNIYWKLHVFLQHLSTFSQLCSLITQLNFGARGPWFLSCWGRKIFLFHFSVVISWMPFTFDFAKRLILELVHHVWLSLRLDNLIVENKNNWAKNHIFLFLFIIVCSVCLSVYLYVCLFASSIFTLSGNKMCFLCEKWTKIHFVF